MSDHDQWLGYSNRETMEIALWVLNTAEVYTALPKVLSNKDLAARIASHVRSRHPSDVR